VTLGGGITIEKGGLSLLSSALKKPFSSQNEYHFSSISFGEYPLSRESEHIIQLLKPFNVADPYNQGSVSCFVVNRHALKKKPRQPKAV
jgi:hypothetical protein